MRRALLAVRRAVPATFPSLIVKSVAGRTVTILLRGPDVTKRAKPAGVSQAFVYSYVGATPPADKSLFRFEGAFARTSTVALHPQE